LHLILINEGEIWWAVGGCPLERFTHTTTLLPDKGKGKLNKEKDLHTILPPEFCM